VRSFTRKRVQRLVAEGFAERQKERELKRIKWHEYARLYVRAIREDKPRSSQTRKEK
jgi:hypothetical protein